MTTIKKQAHETTDQVAEKIHDVVDKAAAGIADTEERLREGAANAAEKVREGAHYAQVRSADLAQAVSGYVRDNPLVALGVAFLAGSIISSLTRRR